MVGRRKGLESYVWGVRKVARESRMLLRGLVLVGCPDIHVVGVTFRSKQLPVHGGRANDCYLTRMAYYLLHLYIRMLLSRIIVKYGLQLRDQIMVLFGNFNIRQHYIVGVVSPGILDRVVNTVSLA